MALCFASAHTTDSLHLTDQRVTEAANLPADAFLPSASDTNKLRERMVVIVQRILVKNWPSLKSLEKHVPVHIRHRFTSTMQKETSIVKKRLRI